MNITIKTAILALFGIALAGPFALHAASTVAGTLSAGAFTASSADGTLAGTVTGGPSGAANDTGGATTNGDPDDEDEESTGGRSGTRRGAAAAAASAGGGTGTGGSDIIIALDSGLTGTGGGFDPSLEQTLSAIGTPISSEGSEIGFLSPEDAVAFNNAFDSGPFENTAATGGNPIGSGKLWIAIALGVALLGLAAYAVNALLGLKR